MSAMMASSSGRAFSMSSRRTCLTSSLPCGVAVGAAELALGRRQHPAQPHHHQVVDEIGAGLFRPAAHVVELEADDGVADLGFELSLGLRHGCPRTAGAAALRGAAVSALSHLQGALEHDVVEVGDVGLVDAGVATRMSVSLVEMTPTP